MALVRFNGFKYDDAASLPLDGWTCTAGTGTAVIDADGGPTTDYAAAYVRIDRKISCAWTPHATVIMGMRMKVSEIPTASDIPMLVNFTYLGATQVLVHIEGNGKLGVYSPTSSTQIALSEYVVVPNTWFYIEFKVLCHNTAGTVEIRINGSAVADVAVTGKDTRAHASVALIDGMDILATSVTNPTMYLTFTDLYVCTGANPAPCNDFLGDVRVNAFLPSGATGTSGPTELTPSTGSNYACVDEATINAADYVSGTAGKDVYNFPDLGFTPLTLYAIAIKNTAKKNDAGARYVNGVLRYSGVNYPGALVALSDGSHKTYSEIRVTDPSTTNSLSAFSGSAAETFFNACEFGPRVS